MEFLLWLEFCTGILAVVNVAGVPTVVNFPFSTGSGVPANVSAPAVPIVCGAAVGPAVDVFSQLLSRPLRSTMTKASAVVASLLLLRSLLLLWCFTSWRPCSWWYPCFCWLLAVVGFPAVAVSLLWV